MSNRKHKARFTVEREEEGFSPWAILFGPLLVIIALPMLWLNEGQAVRHAQTLGAGHSTVVSLSSREVRPDMEGRLIHLTGFATTDETLTDGLFHVSVPQALKLKRQVEMYQWAEKSRTNTRTDMDGNPITKTDYAYHKVWSQERIQSEHFKHPQGHENPHELPFRTSVTQATLVTLGAFRLGNIFIDQIDSYTLLPITSDADPPPGFKPAGNNSYYRRISDVTMAAAGHEDIDVDPPGEDLSRAGPASPEIGDVRVRFHAVMPGTISIIGRQMSGTVVRIPMPKGGIAIVKPGRVNASTMITAAKPPDEDIWGKRIGGTVMLWLGFKFILDSLQMIASLLTMTDPVVRRIVKYLDIIEGPVTLPPILIRIVNAGTDLTAILLTIGCSLLMTGLPRIFHHPLQTAGMIFIAVIAFALIWSHLRQARADSVQLPSS